MQPAAAVSLATSTNAAVVILVEGESDQGAVEAMARRQGIDLQGARILVVPMGGASGIARFVELLGDRGLGLPLVGLYDEAEIGYVRRALERAGWFPRYLGSRQDLFEDVDARAGLAALGFHACVVDLEDELIRALGAEAVLAVVAAEHELQRFQTLAQQPDHRGEPVEAQLHRFLGTRSGRKIHYPPLLVEALPPGSEPACLVQVLRSAVALIPQA
ncbi:ATP-dependent endonuclease [Kineosporia babensis]|uniref:ATP-dependent endonuclease n=1 Tax=Kineosporia babensis TaxID=499548 RepID=A0A9X1NMF6_9ACTN|nr:ATP-dependent endonuclease [Kineosporia babensis]MCD5316469.1 ATP-dependent endonuclease [Kineosporia babensis]